METAQIWDNARVQQWVEGLRKQSNVAVGPGDERLELLAGFCEHMDESPDELVGRCFRTRKKDGVTAISSKNRKQISTAIDEYVQKTGRSGYDAIKAANMLRSFLIHNGVLVTGTAYRGR